MILYLLKFMISSVVLFAFYHFFLAREKTLTFNRFYLLAALAFSLLIPFFQLDFYEAPAFEIPEYAVNPEITSTSDLPVVEKESASSSTYNLSFFVVLAGLYFIITALMSIRFIADLTRLIKRIYICEKNSVTQGKLVLVNVPCLPYSFFQYIFVNKQAYENGNIDPYILKHEATHVRQWHSIDVLFIALVQVFFWFNPIIFLYKRAIQLNHEYLADAAVLAQGANLYNYQKMLLQLISGKSTTALTCNFNYSSTKKRLLMMTTENQFIRSIKKQLFTIPMLVILILALGCEDATLKEISQLESHASRITREKITSIQAGKTTTTELVEMFGEPDMIYPIENHDLENWFYYTWKGNEKEHTLSLGTNTKTKKVRSFLHYHTYENGQVFIQPEELNIPIFNTESRSKYKNPQGVVESLIIKVKPTKKLNVNDIESLYGKASLIMINEKMERWLYKSPYSSFEFRFDREENVYDIKYVYKYALPHYEMNQ